MLHNPTPQAPSPTTTTLGRSPNLPPPTPSPAHTPLAPWVGIALGIAQAAPPGSTSRLGYRSIRLHESLRGSDRTVSWPASPRRPYPARSRHLPESLPLRLQAAPTPEPSLFAPAGLHSRHPPAPLTAPIPHAPAAPSGPLISASLGSVAPSSSQP